MFKDQDALNKLNAIIHPRVIATQDRLIGKVRLLNPRAIIVVDVPLLIEAGYHHKVDVVIVVTIDPEIQISRLMDRDGIDRTEAVHRVGLQMPLDQKARIADYVIDNSGSPDETRQQVVTIMDQLKTR